MDTISRHGLQGRISVHSNHRKARKDEQIVRMKLRYEELDAEFVRENRRLSRMVRQLKQGLNKKIF